jgi:DsbC/DsbD-like thiol-disulfide interchange protein
MKSNIKILLFVFLLAIISQSALAKPAHRRAVAPEPEPTIHFKGYYSSDKARRGTVVRVAVVLDIPDGYHVNANKPLGKYAIPTTVKIEAPDGVTVGLIAFPRAIVRKLKATNNESLAVYEGKAIMRFNLTVPANYGDGWLNLRASVRYQSCNDDVCFPPKNQQIDFGIGIVAANEPVQRANGWVFGGK